jgi:molecular chaperone GrpE (heat shock protein)
LNSLREELVEQKDLNLRLAADLENFKRRSRQEDEVFQQGSRRGAKIFRPAKVAVNDLTHSKQARHAR